MKGARLAAWSFLLQEKKTQRKSGLAHFRSLLFLFFRGTHPQRFQSRRRRPNIVAPGYQPRALHAVLGRVPWLVQKIESPPLTCPIVPRTQPFRPLAPFLCALARGTCNLGRCPAPAPTDGSKKSRSRPSRRATTKQQRARPFPSLPRVKTLSTTMPVLLPPLDLYTVVGECGLAPGIGRGGQCGG